MIRFRAIRLKLIFSFFVAFIMLNFIETGAKAATTTDSYYFLFNGNKITNGTEAELTRDITTLSVTTSEGFDSASTVTWESDEKGVVKLEDDPAPGTDSVNVLRMGPGYSTIIATIKTPTGSHKISFVIKVKLEIDEAETNTVLATTTGTRIMTMDTIGQEEKVFLKYVDYTTSSGSVTGSAIDASAVIFTSDNNGVVTVDSTGKVKAIGAGTAKITATSATMSSQNKIMSDTITVVVLPTYTLTFATTGSAITYTSIKKDTDTGGFIRQVPSSFVLESNATDATNLVWEVYDSKGNKIKEGTSALMTYTISEESGNVVFTGVKAGTYEIYAMGSDQFNRKTNLIPYAYMKLEVPINLNDANIVMTVGDTYSILDNSNIPYANVFSAYTNEDEKGGDGTNIATVEKSTYTITAMKKGKVTITLTYNPGLGLFDNYTIVPNKVINVTVIDGISLSTTYATIYTKGTLKLDALTTDNTSPIEWSSSDTKIATVASGVVTGVKEGTVTITAKQTVDGVIKKATCTILVQQSVSTIVLDPKNVTLAINAYQTIHATITPSLNGVTLTWKSSNEDIVKVVENSALTATIQAVAGGTAVISAINQDNVVVGYCSVSVRQPVTSIVLSESAATVSLNSKTLQIRASVYPEVAMNKKVNWTSSDTSKATVDANGLVTFKSSGTVSIIATSDDSPAVKSICNLNIQVPVVSVALDEATKILYVGQSARLTYSLLPANASTNTVIWTSTNPSAVTVDNTGKVTAKSVGTSVIILKTIDGAYTVYCTITVKQVASGVKFDVSELKLKVGEYYYIKVTLTPKGSTDNDLVWESSDTKVATVDDNGKVIGKAAGSAIIMARTEAGGIAYCKVNVTQPVQSLLLNFTEKTIYVNTKFTIEVSLTPSSATNLNVTWKSSNTKVATVSKSGEVTGIVGGTAIITCTTADGGFTSSCVVTVKESVTTIKLDYENYNLGVDKTFKLTATVTNETATNQEVMWTSSNESIATVNQKGRVTGIKKGYVTITATALDGSEVEAYCEVRVVTPVDSITISDNYVSLYVGDTEKLTVSIKPKTATFNSAKWTSSDNSVAIVDDDGVVTALKAGTATITAETLDNSGKKVICAVAVYDRVPATGITLQDKRVTMVPGEERVVEVVLIPSASTDSMTWSSDNPSIAKVNKKTGKITAVSTGTAYISIMTDSGKTASIELTVIGLNITSIVLEQYTNFSTRLVVEGATSPVTWSIDNNYVAQVTNGNVSSRGVGTATITAMVNGRKLKCKIKVIKIQ